MSEPKASELKQRKVMMFDRKVGGWSRYVVDWAQYDIAVRELAKRVIRTGHRIRMEIHPLTKDKRYGIYAELQHTPSITDVEQTALIYASTLDELIPHMKLLGGGANGKAYQKQDR